MPSMRRRWARRRKPASYFRADERALGRDVAAAFDGFPGECRDDQRFLFDAVFGISSGLSRTCMFHGWPRDSQTCFKSDVASVLPEEDRDECESRETADQHARFVYLTVIFHVVRTCATWYATVRESRDISEEGEAHFFFVAFSVNRFAR